MTSSSQIPFYIQENQSYSKEWEKFWVQTQDTNLTLYRAINSKDIAIYSDVEIQNGQTFYVVGTAQDVRNGFRIVIDTGALLNAAPTAVNHLLNGGAAVPNTWMFTRVYGFAIDPVTPLWIPLANGGIHDCSLQVTATQVIITPTVNLAAFTQSYVVLEFWKA